MLIRILNFEEIRKELEQDVGKGFVRLPIEAIEDSRLTRSAMVVLAIIIDKSDSGSCKASAPELSAAANVGIASTKRAIKELEELGYITVIRRTGGTNEYIQNDILPPKKRDKSKKQVRTAEDEPDFDTALKLWEEAGVLQRIKCEGVTK